MSPTRHREVTKRTHRSRLLPRASRRQPSIPGGRSLARQIDSDKPRNVILLIGDGTDESIITAARNYEKGADGAFALDSKLPFVGDMTVHGLKVGPGPDYPIAYVSDSAPTASAWSTGHKTVDGEHQRPCLPGPARHGGLHPGAQGQRRQGLGRRATRRQQDRRDPRWRPQPLQPGDRRRADRARLRAQQQGLPPRRGRDGTSWRQLAQERPRARSVLRGQHDAALLAAGRDAAAGIGQRQHALLTRRSWHPAVWSSTTP
jgi:hypothetical protein